MSGLTTLLHGIQEIVEAIRASTDDTVDDAHLLARFPNVATMTDEELHLAAESYISRTDPTAVHTVSMALHRLRETAGAPT